MPALGIASKLNQIGALELIKLITCPIYGKAKPLRNLSCGDPIVGNNETICYRGVFTQSQGNVFNSSFNGSFCGSFNGSLRCGLLVLGVEFSPVI